MMAKLSLVHLSLGELCEATSIQSETIIEIVDQGIVEPMGDTPENWRFNAHMVTLTRKALRLHRDLELDWAGIAFALSLIEEMERLREENKQLKSLLNRFM